MEGHIWIDGIITENYHLEVKRQLQANSNVDVIVLHIQSPGGSVYSGYNTYHLLKSSGKKIRTIIEGEAQSIATFIALAGDTVEIRKPSVFMIHNPFAGLEGDADKMLNGASELRNIENDMATIYSMKTRIPIEQIKEMMKKETSMNAEQAVQFGFADRAIDPLKMVAIGKTKNMEDKSTESIFDDLKNRMNAIAESLGIKAETPKIEEPPKETGIEAAPEQPAPKAITLEAGEYPLQDGRVIIVDESGMIIEVKEKMPEMPPMPEPDDNAAKIAAIQAELDALKASATASEAKAVQAVEVAKEAVRALGELKKKTVGDDKAPMAGVKFDRTPVSAAQTDNDKEMQKEIFASLGLSHLIK
jgi:ATP-dependent Clp endopeptidase proteolytic subunit ClpP